MQGTGTQADPYIPTMWDEFVTAIGTSGAYVSLPEGGGVFDMNEIAPEGGITIGTHCASISGNDWEIRNAYNIKFQKSSGELNINKLHFLNFYCSLTYGMFYFSDVTITESKFSGIAGGNSRYLMSYVQLRRCSMNLKFIDNAVRPFEDTSTELYFSKAVIDQSESLSTYSDSIYVNCYNSFIEHKANAGGKQLRFVGHSSILHSDAGNYITTSGGDKVSVTEEQLGDASYLASVGFPIVS